MRAPLPLRVLPMPLGTLCTGILPSCARHGDTGLHLRIGMLAGLREDRSVGWVQGDLGFLVSVMRWAELGVYLPVTWFDSIRPTLQPLRFGGKLAFLSPSRWQRLWGSVFTEVRIAKGPFSGAGSPLGQQPTAVDVGVALETRLWLLHAQGLAWLTGSQSGLELHAGAEAGLRGEAISPFVQVRLDSRPGCPPSESPLCGVGGAIVGGLRGSFDAVSAAPLAGVAQGSGHALVLAGLHTGLSFDVAYVQRHGDGSAAAQAWWQRRLDSARAWWAEQLAEREYAPLTEQLRRQRGALWRALGERLSSHLDEIPDPLEALRQWQGAVASDAAQVREFLDAPLAGATISELREKMAARQALSAHLKHSPRGHKPPALRRDADGSPRLSLPGAGLCWERMVAEQTALFEELERERRQREEALQVPYRPMVLPPMEKVVLNSALLAPFELLAPLFLGSPEAVAQVAEARRKLRLLPYTPEEQEQSEALEAAYQTLFGVGAGLASSASRAAGVVAARQAAHAMEAQASRLAAQAARAAEPAAARATSSAARSESLLSRSVARLNPSSYVVDGLGSNFGNVRFRPPRGISTTLPELAEGAEAARAPSAVAADALEEATKAGHAQAKPERVGRGKNHLRPDYTAEGPHSTFRRDEQGDVAHHAEWTSNPRHPGGWDEVKRVDMVGAEHMNSKTGELVYPPHTHDKKVPGGVRKAEPDEVPLKHQRR